MQPDGKVSGVVSELVGFDGSGSGGEVVVEVQWW